MEPVYGRCLAVVRWRWPACGFLQRGFGSHRLLRWLFPLLLFPFIVNARADNTFVYAVQISATVQSSPPQILLQWLPDPYGANSYTVYRKSKSAVSWGSGVALSGSASNYTDAGVVAGSAYEYQVIKAATLGYI